MGPVWYKQPLINIVAFFIAFNMAVGVVAISSRREQGSLAMAGHVKEPAAATAPKPTPATTKPAGQSSHPTQTSNQSVAAGAIQAPATATAAQSGPVATTGTASQARATATGSSRRQTTATTGRRSTPSTGGSPTVTTAPAPVAATGSPSGAPATTDESPAEPGETTQTTKPAKPATTTTTRPAPPGPSTQSIDDPRNDTVLDGGAARSAPRGDLVRSKANYTTKAILFAVLAAEAADPTQDARWASQETYVSWEIDTNLDGTADYVAEYFVEGGQLGGDVFKADDASATSLCGVEAAISSDGYTLGIDPACIGNPAAFAYRATSYYDTGSGVVVDVAPDTAYSRSLGRPKS